MSNMPKVSLGCSRCSNPRLKHSSYCRDHYREYQRLWIAKRRAEFFKNKTCILCGSEENLELDHIDPSTKVSHTIWSWSEKRRLEEIAKCQILCHDCHVRKTIKNHEKAHGDQKKNAKLVDNDVVEIKKLYSRGVPASEICQKYLVDRSNFYKIIHGKAWRHVD